jgi:tetraacyldisaccharide 4'-kinase
MSREQTGESPATPREETLLRILSGEDKSWTASLIRAGLWGLVPLYGLGIAAYRGMYDFRMLEEVRLPCPVVSIGNLTVGGTGKTGLALTLAGLFRREGLKPALLNYGYHAGIGRGPAVVSDGENLLLTPAEAGDEAVLLAKRLPGVPVLIGKRRIESGALAVERFRPDLLLLDDAFQYWRLARDVNLVLLNAREPWGYGSLLPRGLLRELPSTLRRATAVVLTHTERSTPESLSRLEAEVRRFVPQIPLFTANYKPHSLRLLGGEQRAGLELLRGQRVGALSGLGSPGDFEAGLVSQGAGELHPYRFSDHYAYRAEDMETVHSDADHRGLTMIVTTEKDAVKLETLDLSCLSSSTPIFVLEAELDVEPRESFEEWIMGHVRSSGAKLTSSSSR